jgi:hypothetical protein
MFLQPSIVQEMCRVHNQTANEHDVYLPFTIRSSFFQYYIQHLKTIVEPAAEMIRKYLTELGVTDIDEYMKDSDDWLSLLFADRKCHYAASHIAAQGFNINIEELPAIVIWTGLDRRSVVIIYPYSRVDYMKDYIRAIYRSIVEVSRDLIQADRSININIFKDRLENSIEAEPYRENMFIKVRSIERRRLDRPSSVIKTIWK